MNEQNNLSVQPLPLEWQTELQTLFEDARNVGAVVTLVKGSTVYAFCHGITSISNPQPVTLDTGFQLCSLTKAYTATVACALAVKSFLDLDAPVRPILSELCFDPEWINDEISLRDLLSNRVGLARGGMADYGLSASISKSEYLRRFCQMRRTAPFRSGFTYCNPAFSAAVLVLERLTEETFMSILERLVLAPCGMTSTCFGEAAQSDPLRAQGHTIAADHRLVEVNDDADWNWIGGGGLFSTARDQLAWLQLNLGRGEINGHRVLPAEVWDQLWHIEVGLRDAQREIWLGDRLATFAAYGLGWFLSTYHGRRMVAHTGGGVGYRTRHILLPDDQIALSILTNTDGKVSSAVQHRLLEMSLNLPATAWSVLIEERRVQSAHAARLALDRKFSSDFAEPIHSKYVRGTYFNREAGVGRIDDDGQHLLLTFRDAPSFDGRLAPLGGSIFEHHIAGGLASYNGPDYPAPRIKFVMEDDTRCSGFHHSDAGEFLRI